MNDFSEYKYGRVLRFFDAYYPYDTEDIHYSEVLLSMNNCSSIDELITIRERLKKKIKTIKAEPLSKMPKEIIEESIKFCSIHDTLYTALESNLRSDVNSCYDENVLRLLRETKEITANFCGECFLNLSDCVERSENKVLIINEAKERANIDVSDLLETIAQRYEDFRNHWTKYKGFEIGMNGYDAAKQDVEDDFEYLKQFNWRLLPEEKKEYRVIDREEIKKKEEEEKALRIAQIEKEEKERIREEQKREKERKREKREKIFNITVGVIAMIIIGVLAYYLDNWFFAILIIFLLLKAGLK